tara:strand:+ start:71 stop:595 length:525 start_codon:yes stop_codon:yes gene_type:complete
MSYEVFLKTFNRSVGNEGGFTNDRRDRGNWTSGKIGVGKLNGTKQGVSAMTYPNLDIINLTDDEIKEIYYRDWWLKLGMDKFRPAISYQMFDAAINHGMSRATKLLQKAVGATADGVIGPNTMGKVKDTELNDLLFKFIAERLQFFTDIRTFDTYGRGWSRRIAHNLKLAAEDN